MFVFSFNHSIILLNLILFILLSSSSQISIVSTKILFVLSFFYGNSIIPFPFFSGNNINNFSIDNCNIGFILVIIVLFPIIYGIIGFESLTRSFSFQLVLIFLYLLVCLIFNYLLWLFLLYEILIICLFFILFIFISSFYRIRTAFYLFVFTILGTIGFSFGLLFMICSKFYFSLIIILPLIIKIPSFPFYYWLPEIHCEANTSISLLLAGIILKLSIYGIMRFILYSFFMYTNVIFIFTYFIFSWYNCSF